MKPNKKKWIKRAVILVILIALAIGLYFLINALYNTEKELTHGEPVVHHYDDKPEILTLETDALKFEFDTATTHFTLTQKESGRTWTDIPENGGSDPVAQPLQKAVLQSNLLVYYRTSVGVEDYVNSYTHAIQNQNYTVEQGEDGSIIVHYSIGKIDKVFAIPEAIPVETYNLYVKQLSTKDQKKLTPNYVLYDEKKVASLKPEELESLREKYPKLMEEALYILKPDTKENSKASIEQYLQSVGYTEEINEELKNEYFPSVSDSAKCVFNVDMIYRLEGNDLIVEVPINTICYEDAFPISSVTILPVFGASGVNDEGFMLVPEGGGAIINNNNGKEWQNRYRANVYGMDYAKVYSEAIHETRDDFALFGVGRDGGSFLCFIEKGASFAQITADVSLKKNQPMSYNIVYANCTVLHNDAYKLDKEKQGTVVTYEKYLPNDSIVQRYRFLETDDYIQMAQAYGDYLRQNAALKENAIAADMPVNVELVSSINKKVVKAGLPVDSLIPTTTFDQSGQILGELMSEGGFKNMSARITGWANGGLNQSILKSVKVESKLGGQSGLDALIKLSKDKGIDLYLDGVTCFAYDSDVFDGFIAYSDAARFVTREQAKIYPYSPASYQPDEEKEAYYLVKPALAAKMADNLIDYLAKNNAAGISFRDIGMLLSADYNQKETVTREEAKAMNVETLAKAGAQGLKVMVKEGNDYVLGHVDLITDMDLKGTEYSIIDKTIPFYQIAIHGSVNYTGAPINLASDYISQLLACAEYGAGLNFTFMYEDTKVLQDSVYSGYYAASYQRWKEDMLAIAARYQREMAGLNNQKITGHEYLAGEVTRTVYADGTSVLVNYSMQDYDYNGTTVPARDYAVIRED
ncbi:MAG: hypothetical protein IJM56_03635 [Clostridia bacterium]|nr:hypothetical protein [Clostridia bacterium]